MDANSSKIGSRRFLHAVSGSHAGATHELAEKPYVIGSSLDADIVLTDPRIAGRHARITPARGYVEIEALESSIVAGTFTLQPAETIEVRYPVTLEVGAAKLSVVSQRVLGPIPLLVLGGAAATVLLVAEVYSSGAKPFHLSRPSIASVNVTAGSAQKEKPAETKGTSGAVEAMQQRLNAAHLSSLVVSSSLGSVFVAGSIAPAQEAEWRAAQVWFDEKYGQTLPLQAEVKVSPEKSARAPVTVQSVWLGKFPYFIDGEGNKHLEGSVLKDGWVLEKIADNKIMLKRHNEPLVIRLD